MNGCDLSVKLSLYGWFLTTVLLIMAPFFVDSTYFLRELSMLGFDIRFYRTFSSQNIVSVVEFLALFVPKILFLVFVVNLLLARKIDYVIALFQSRLVIIIISLILTLVVFYIVGYFPVVIATFLLISFCFGISGTDTLRMLLAASLLGLLILVLDVPRGMAVLGLLALLVGSRDLRVGNAITLFIIISSILVITTFSKFNTDEVSSLLNPLSRISSAHQFVIYSFIQQYHFDMDRPVTLDMLFSLPIIRNGFIQLDEGQMFFLVTEGSSGGLAVSPEIRAISYWQTLWPALFDLAVMYFILYVILKFILRLSSGAYVGLAIVFPYLVMFESMSVASFVLQVVIFSILIVEVARHVVRHGRSISLRLR